MKAGPIEVGRLLQNRWRFCVPIYQRHYVWSRQKQWEPFWNDIRTKAVERLAGRDRRFSHFMGAVVLEARGGFSATRVPSFQVVDGQQRLTTFEIFLAAARDYASASGFPDTAENISTYLLNDKPHLMEEPEVEIYKVWPTQYDRELFENIITLGRKNLRPKYSQYFYASQDRIYDYSTVPRLLSAYGYFYDRIRHSVETDDLDDEFTEAPEIEYDKPTANSNGLSREIKLGAIWQSLVEEFKVVEIVLEDGDDAQVIFETLNERGEPLLAADLIRNNIFQRADAAREKPEQLFSAHWTPFEAPFWSVEEKQGRYKKPRVEFFFSNFIAGKIAGEVNLSKLFSEYKAFVKRQKYLSVAAELQDIGRLGAIYREVVERSGNSALSRFSRRLLPWDVTTVFPLVLRLWDNADLVEEQKARCLEFLLAFIVRRAVCGLTNKNYNKFFLSVIAHLDCDGWGDVKLAAFSTAQKADTSRFPSDEEFEQRWLSNPVYTILQPARSRAVLEEIELAKRTAFHETKDLAPSLSVEHVLPQQWEKTWPLADGTFPTAQQIMDALFGSAEDNSTVGLIARRNRLLNTFGNLTLLTTPLNFSVSNGPFMQKREALDEHSLLVLNRELCKYETWDEESILTRGKSLFSVARELWPLPAVTAQTFAEAAF
jgi:Protein of unknown function DUF262/Protein of unknown function (DUF1524)